MLPVAARRAGRFLGNRRVQVYVTAFVATFVLLALFYSRPQPISPPNPDDVAKEQRRLDRELARIVKRDTEVLIIGNSMVGEGIDDDLVSDAAGRSVTAIHRGGSSAAWWYLAATKLTRRIPNPPREVVVAFRDTALSQPSFRVEGSHYKSYIGALGGLADDNVIRLSYASGPKRWDYLMRRYIPFYSQNEAARQWLYDEARDVTGNLLGLSPAAVTEALDRGLSEDRLSQRLLTQYQLAAEEELGDENRIEDFRPEKTFLPAMFGDAKARGIELAFIRIKRRRDALGQPVPEGLVEYNRALDAYLAANGARLLDMTHSDLLGIEQFAAGDHLNRQDGRRRFSERVGDFVRVHSRRNRSADVNR
jgi:hypothetical protein